MLSKYLWEFGSLIIFTLGMIHLYYTFFTNKFSSKNQSLVEAMKSSYPLLTRKTTLWKAWMGFNASHAAGAIFIGVTNFYLAFRYFETLQSDPVFFLFNILTIGFYLWLAKRYWFNIPFVGILVTLICFVISYVLTLLP